MRVADSRRLASLNKGIMKKPREVLTVCLHLRAFGCEQCKAVLKQYHDALEWCARALKDSSQDRGLVADHGDALDNAYKVLGTTEE